MSNKIKKAIILAGGLGIRFLPATKAQPKEMLPIVDKPALQYIVEEAVKSGIEEVLIITGRNKSSIENHFDKSVELEETLIKNDDFVNLEKVRQISDMANIYYARQGEPNGILDAIYRAKSFIEKEEYFAVLIGDIIIDSKVPCLKQLIDVHSRYNTPILGVQNVKKKEVINNTVINPLEVDDKIYKVKSVVDKPSKKAPSTKAIIGRYILEPDVFNLIDKMENVREAELSEVLNNLLNEVSIYALEVEGKKYDLGSKIDFLEANIDFALNREEFRDDLVKIIKAKLDNIK